MVCGLFHCFDTYVEYKVFGMKIIDFPLKWIFLAFLFSMFNWQIFLGGGQEMVLKSGVTVVWGFFSSLLKYLVKSFFLLFPLISLILLVNLLGLVPFVFTSTSHLSFNFSLSASLWLGGVLVSLYNSVWGFFSHMVPTGTPFALWSFLVMVETVSQFIRPMTLSIRLMANVMAGHLIVNLLSSFVSSNSVYLSLIPLQSGFLLFEFFVSAVQAYVFVSLLSLYWDEG